MAYFLHLSDVEVKGKGKYANAQGHTECVEFVRRTTSAPHTSAWKQGLKVKTASPGSLLHGVVIATFDSHGHYPTDALGKHAAIYLRHNSDAIWVLDQFASQGEVLERPIWFNKPAGTKRSNDGNYFYVVE